MSKSDQNQDGHVDFAEFVQYVMEHEKQPPPRIQKDRPQPGRGDRRPRDP